MRRKVVSVFLTVCMVLSMLPSTAFAVEAEEVYTQSLTLPVVTEGEELPKAQGYGGGISLFSLIPNRTDYAYTYEGVSRAYPRLSSGSFTFLVAAGVEPASGGVLQVVDGEGKIRAGSHNCYYYKDNSYKDESGATEQWYVSSASFDDEYAAAGYKFADVPAGEYALQLAVGEERYTVDQQLCVVDRESLLIREASAHLYYDNQEAEVYFAIHGLESEADLAKMSLTLTDEDGDIIARSTGAYREFGYNSYDGYWTFYMELAVEEDESLASYGRYSLTISDTGSRPLVDGVGGVEAYTSEHQTELGGGWFSDAQNGVFTVELNYPRAGTAYDVTVCEDWEGTTVYGSWNGVVPENGQITIPLTMNGLQASADSYPGNLYVRWKIGSYSYWNRTSVDNPYRYSSNWNAQFEPSAMSSTTKTLPFTLELYNFSAYRGDGTDVLTVCDNKGARVAECSSFTEDWKGSQIYLAGTLNFTGSLDQTRYVVFLNGVEIDTLRVTDEPSFSWRIAYSDWNGGVGTLWTNFDVLPVSADVFNSSGSARIELRDEAGNVLLTTGPMTQSAGEYAGYVHYEGAFKQEDLEQYADTPMYLTFVDGSYVSERNDAYYYDSTQSAIVFYNANGGNYTVDVSWWNLNVGDTTLELGTYQLRNVSEAELLDRLGDLRLVCGDTTVTVTGLRWDDPEDLYYGLSAVLSAPITAGVWNAYDGNTELCEVTVSGTSAEQEEIRVGDVDTDGWYMSCRNLPKNSAYTAKIYQNYTCLTEQAFELTLYDKVVAEGTQYLRLPKAVVSELERGEYELRVYRDGILLDSVELTVEGDLQPTITMGDEFGNRSRIIRGDYVYFEVNGSWGYFRAAESEAELADAEWYDLDFVYDLSDTETIGERTIYVQLSEDANGTTASDVVSLTFLYLGRKYDNKMDVHVREDVEGFYSGDSVTLSLGADYPYAYGVVELEDGSGRVSAVRLNYQGKGELPGLDPAASSGELIASPHPYNPHMDKTWEYTLPGAERIEVTFSAETEVENNWDWLYVYYVEDGVDVLYNDRYTGTSLAGQTLTLPGNTVKVRLTSDSGYQSYGFGVVSVVDPDAQPEEGEEAEPAYHIYSTTLNTADYLGTEKLSFYLVEDADDTNGDRWSLVSDVEERSLIFGDPTAVILPQFRDEDKNYVLINKTSYALYGYAIPNSTVTLTYRVGDGSATLGTATAAANGKFTMELTDLAEGFYGFTVTSQTEDNVIYGYGELEVDITAPHIEGMGFAFSDSDTATLSWSCNDVDLYRSTVYLVTESGEQRLGYVYTSAGTNGVFSMTVTASSNDGQQFKVVVEDNAGNKASRTISTSDQEPPTAPGALIYADRTAATVTLNWTAGTDNVGVAGYNIYKNGERIAQTTGTGILSYEVTDLEQGTEYTFCVATRDLAGNLSDETECELTVATAKLSVDAAIPGTITTNGAGTVSVTVQGELSADVTDYVPGVEQFYIRYQAQGNNAAPVQNGWIEQTLGGVSLSGSTGKGTWSISVPADAQLPLTYWVQVVAADGEGVVAYSDVKTLTLADGRVNFTVKDSKTGDVIPGADVSVYQDGALKLSGTADAQGKILLGLEDGSYSLVARADGYQMRSIPGVTISEDRLEFTIYMNTEDILQVETTVKEMTYDEIVAAGIDPAAAGNQHVYECTVILDFVPIKYICAGDQVLQSEPVQVGDHIVYPAARDIFLIIPTRTTWLKEMFDVQLLVTNSSTFEDVENCVANLTLPNGLSLAEMSDGIQSVTASLGTITPGGSASHHWYVRGDAEGDYTISGDVTGTRVGGGLSEDIAVGFTTQDPISVLAGSAMKLTIEAERAATIGEPYNMRFTLQNVSNKSLYNVNFDVLGGTFRQAYDIKAVLASYDLEGPFKPDADNSELLNGFVLSAEEFKPADILSGVFTITFGEGIDDPDAVRYMLKKVFLFTGAGSTTEIPTEVIFVDEVSDHVHTYDEGVVTKEPTCTEDGVKTFTCTTANCGETFTVDVPAAGHSMGQWVTTKDATCTESGAAESECINAGCDFKDTMTLSALGHSYSEEWTTDLEPTCTAEGSKSRHCVRQGCDAKTDVTVIPENGHSYGLWEKHSETQHKHACTVETCKFVEYADHTWNDGVETTAPTHLTEGVKTFTCTEATCGQTRTESIDKLPDHLWGDWQSNGATQHKRECPCSESETADHGWSGWTTTAAPTCMVDGEERRDCADCEAYETKPIPAPGHSWNDGVVTKEPTLDEEGVRTFTCTVCGGTKTEAIAKLQQQDMYFSTNLLNRDMVKAYGDPSFVDMLFNDSVDEPVVTYASSDERVATVDENGWVTIKGAGTAIISATSAAVPYRYVETTASYKLVVNKASLTVTVNDAAIVYGEAFAPNGYAVDGFVYSETADVLSGEAVYSCRYAQYGAVGEYPITMSGLAADNYEITVVPGKLTVSKASNYNITFGNLSQKSDAVTPATAAITPQDETAVIVLEYKVADQWTTQLPTAVGTYPVRAKLTASTNIALDDKVYGDQLVIQAVDSIGGVSVSVKTDEEKAMVEVSDEDVARIVDSLNGTNGDLAVNLESVEKNTLVLPGNLVEELNKSGNLNNVTVKTENSSISMSDSVLDTMAEAMDKEDTVSLQMNTKETDELDQAQKDALESIGGPGPQTVVLELKLTVADSDGNVKREIKELGDKVDITIQCSQEMQNKRVVACYISPDGTVTYLVAKYDEATNTLSFKTDHFSIYAAVELGDDERVVYVVDKDGVEQPAVGAGPQTVGTSVTVQAPAAPGGYRFSGWQVVSGTVTLTNASSASTTFTMPEEDVTLKPTYSRRPAVVTGGSGGSTPTTYTLTVDKSENGSITLSGKEASAGDSVTITVKADEGYCLDALTILDKNGKEVEVTKKSDTEYTFNMPAGKVVVKAAFAEIVVVRENPFVDVTEEDYYYDAVLWAVENGITGGTSATTFSPAAVCTRAQMIMFLWRVAGSPETAAACPFTDVTPGDYYYHAVLWAVENGITSGTGATTFSPDDTVTRAQSVTFLWRVAESPAAEKANHFVDVVSGDYYHNAVRWAAETGITAGTSESTFSPENPCLRGQIITFLYRYVKG